MRPHRLATMGPFFVHNLNIGMSKDEQPATGLMFIGVAASEVIDSAGEILKISGCDISELESGNAQLNWEHEPVDSKKYPPGQQLVGRILSAKKIFKKSDCDNGFEEEEWDKIKSPFIVIICRLYDGAGHPGAQAIAAIMRDHYVNGEKILCRLSIEGGTVDRDKKDRNIITDSIAKRVSITIGPANKTCDVQVIKDPNAPKDFYPKEVNEKEILDKLGKSETEITVFDVDLKGAFKLYLKSKILKKALEAGSYNSAPGTLTQGSALQREFITSPSKSKDNQKKKALDFLKSYDLNKYSQDDFKKSLKEQVPDIDPEFLEKFSSLVDGIVVSKRTLKKNQLIQKMEFITCELRKDDYATNVGKIPKQPKAPASDMATNPLRAPKAPGLESTAPAPSPKNIRNDGGIFSRTSPAPLSPSPTPKGPAIVNAELHGSGSNDKSQNEMIHGMNLGNVNKEHGGLGGVTANVGLVQNNGKSVFVKPHGSSEHIEGFSAPQREVATHNVARDFFKLGEHVPKTSMFTHPETGEHHSAQEWVQGASHFNRIDPSEEHTNILNNLGSTGKLDKLGIMDHVIGNVDRHGGNFLFSKDNMHLIDHGYSFHDPTKVEGAHPIGYIKAWNHANESQGKPGVLDQDIHPEAKAWALNLKPQDLKNHLQSHNVPESIANRTVGRLTNLQSQLRAGKGNRGQMFGFGSPEAKAATIPDHGDVTRKAK